MFPSWPEPNQPPVQSGAAADALSRVTTTVAVAQGLASCGRTVDLAGLDAAAGTLCARVLDLPPHEGAILRPALAELDAKLAALTRTLAARHR